MKIRQLSVFIENKTGRLRDVTNLLAENNINIRALSLADTSDFGVLRIIVNDPDGALKLLKENDFVVNETHILAVEVEDTPGGLNKVLGFLETRNINVEYMYAFVNKSGDSALLVLRIEDEKIREAAELLSKNNIKVFQDSEITNL